MKTLIKINKIMSLTVVRTTWTGTTLKKYLMDILTKAIQPSSYYNQENIAWSVKRLTLINYLHERVQRVVLNGQCFNWGRILSVVQIGSALGPLLFLIYLNHLPNQINSICKNLHMMCLYFPQFRIKFLLGINWIMIFKK